MNRIVLLIVAMWLMESVSTAQAPAEPARPNIIVILADDFGYSDLGCYGGEIPTPHIDALAAAGLRFTQFYNAARCCPTRAALLTGLYPHRAGMGWMTGNPKNLPGYRNDLSHDAVTIGELLRPAGYANYMVGKWHVTSHADLDSPRDNWPMQRGFDRYYGTVKGGGSFYDPAMLCRDNTPINPASDPEYRPQRYYYTDAISDHAVRFIRDHHSQHADKPLFLYVAYTAPHFPMHAPADLVAKHKGKYDAGYESMRAARFERMKTMGLIDPRWELSPPAQRWEEQEHKEWDARGMEVYAAMVERMDHGVGEIVEALKAAGELDETLILFLGDNGASAETIGRKEDEARATAATQPRGPDEVQTVIRALHTSDGRPIRNGPGVMPGPEDTFIAYGQGWANVSNVPFRRSKSFTHEGGIASPLVAHWPAGVTRRGELERQVGHVVDLMPTIVELSGATYPAEKAGRPVPSMAGVSLVPALDGKALKREKPLCWEHQGNRGVRDGKWKLVATSEKGPWELYDLEADRTEMHDRAEKDPQRVKAMAAQWQEWAEANNVLPLGAWKKKPGGKKR